MLPAAAASAKTGTLDEVDRLYALNYRFSVVGRSLLILMTVGIVAASVRCTIDHVAHVYCNSSGDCDQPPFSTCDVARHTCINGAGGSGGDGGLPMGDMEGTVGPDMFCTSSQQCSDDAPICSVQR